VVGNAGRYIGRWIVQASVRWAVWSLLARLGLLVGVLVVMLLAVAWVVSGTVQQGLHRKRRRR